MFKGRIHRRQFISLASLTTGAGLLLGRPRQAAPQGGPILRTSSNGNEQSAVTPYTPNGRTVRPQAGPDGIKRITLTASLIEHTLLDAEGKRVVARAYGFDGGTPGPTLVFEEGDQVAITVINQLPEPTAIHWHGLVVPDSQDGVPEVGQPTPLIQPGSSYTYRFQIVQPAGTHMYHSHVNIKSEILGLTGGFIILPRNAHNAGRYSYSQDVIYWLHSWAMPQDLSPQMVMGNMIVGNPAMRERPYTGSPVDTVNSVNAEPDWQTMGLNFFTMNGKSYPSTEPLRMHLGERMRVRFFYINLLSHPIHLHGQNFLHIAEDGVDLQQPRELNAIEVAPGKTQDILIEARNPGIWPFHCHIAHHQANNFSSGFGGMATIIRMGA